MVFHVGLRASKGFAGVLSSRARCTPASTGVLVHVLFVPLDVSIHTMIHPWVDLALTAVKKAMQPHTMFVVWACLAF